MIAQILAFLGIRMTVDSVMSSFNRSIAQLENVQAAQFEKAERARVRLAEERERARLADIEAARAANVAKKMRSIVEGI